MLKRRENPMNRNLERETSKMATKRYLIYDICSIDEKNKRLLEYFKKYHCKGSADLDELTDYLKRHLGFAPFIGIYDENKAKEIYNFFSKRTNEVEIYEIDSDNRVDLFRKIRFNSA